MGFLDERPVAKITSAVMLVITTVAYVTNIVPVENNDVLMFLGGAAVAFLFAGTSKKLS